MPPARFDHRGLTKKRVSKGLSLSALGRELGVTHMAVSYWETGETVPSAHLLPQLADILGCSIDDLYTHRPVVAP